MKISQREARRLRKRVADMEREQEQRLSRWTTDYPGGTHIRSLQVDDLTAESLRTAKLLGFALVAKYESKTIYLYAVK